MSGGLWALAGAVRLLVGMGKTEAVQVRAAGQCVGLVAGHIADGERVSPAPLLLSIVEARELSRLLSEVCDSLELG